MKKIILLLVLLLLSGCYDYAEIEDLSIITGMILDYENDMYKIYTQTLENKNKTEIKTYTTTCYTIDECIYKITNYSNKEVFISHLKTLLLTKSLLKNKTDFYDYFLREAKSKMNFHLYYIDDNKKEDLLNIYNKDNLINLQQLSNNNEKLYSTSFELYFLDYIQMITDFKITPIYPVISVKDNQIFLDGLIAFDKDFNPIKLNNVYLSILKNKITKTLIEIPCNNNYSIEIDKSNTKFNYNNDLEITINIKANLSTYNCKYKLDNIDNINKISNLTNTYIKNNIKELIDIQNKNNIDFIGITSYIYKHTKKKINLKDIKTTIKVNTIINSIGEMKNEF